MIRAFALAVVAALILAALAALAGQPGQLSLEWLGWRADTSAAAALVLFAAATLLAVLAWSLLIWLLAAPRRAARARAEARRREGLETLSRGFVAAASGDASEARRLALIAGRTAEDTPILARLLTAQAAEVAGDDAAAQAAYAAMLGFPELRLAGHRGLMLLALRRGDPGEAVRQASAAYALAKSARWAWRALLDARLAAGDWAAALQLVEDGAKRKIAPPVVAERTRAALLAASAATLETDPSAEARALALEQASEAAKLRPGFAPGVVVAARLLAAAGRSSRAASLIEQAWKTAPHPALALAYRDLVSDETPPQRARRLQGLAAQNPEARESRILMAEQALLAGDPAAARAELEPLEAEPVTRRTAGLIARVAFAQNRREEARAWVARAQAAPEEPDWSDLDPDGRAFHYRRADWARLVATYGETGELTHPRLERQERTIALAPDLPLVYAPAPALVAAEAGGGFAPLPDDPGFDPEEDEADDAPALSAGGWRR